VISVGGDEDHDAVLQPDGKGMGLLPARSSLHGLVTVEYSTDNPEGREEIG